MSDKTALHLAELNIGRVFAPAGDSRWAEFMGALDGVNGLGRRMPGFVRIREGSGAPGTGNTEAKIGGDLQFVSNLTVWESVETLENFVRNTVHRAFYERRAEWFEVLVKMNFLMWWVPEGHRPTLDEELARLDQLHAQDDSDHAFGWAHLQQAKLFRDHQCTRTAAE